MTGDDAAMGAALEAAALAEVAGDVPVGAVVVDASGTVVAVGHNLRQATGDPLAHAEVVALRNAAEATGSWRLDGCTLVVTLEPCTMCAGAVLETRIRRVVFGAWDEKAGAAGSVIDVLRDRARGVAVEVVSGVREEECAALLTAWFARRRA